MKKLLLTLLLSATLIQSPGVIRVKHFDPVLSTLAIMNFVNFAYDYSQFQLSIGNNYYTMAALNHNGNLYMLALAYVYFYNLSLPPSMLAGQEMLAGTSIAIWYPNSLPNNATPANLVDFLEYGSAGHPYESVAVAAGKWTAGDFISVASPYQFNGGINDYGSAFYSTTTSVDEITNFNNALHIFPNPAKNQATLVAANGFNKNHRPVEITIFSSKGEIIETTVKNGAEEYFIDCDKLSNGVYTVRLKDIYSNSVYSRIVKAGQ